MYSMVTTSVLHGMEAILVQVEADVSPGLPTFEMVGFLSSEVRSKGTGMDSLKKLRLSASGKTDHDQLFHGRHPKIRFGI